MRDPKRIEPILDAIRQLWTRCPDARLGQIIVWATYSSDPFYAEDDATLAGLNKMLLMTDSATTISPTEA